MSARVAAVVLHYNRPAGALACVDSLRASTHDAFEVAVVDNGSEPQALDELVRGVAARDGVQLVKLSPNRGYTGGMNAAFEHALATNAPYLWLLADDVFVDPAAMAAQVAVFEARPRAGLAGAMTYYASDPARIWFAGGFVSPRTFGPAKHRGIDQEDRGQFTAVDPIDFANGSSLFARRSVAAQVGGFDDVYFTYWEDIDWSARVAAAGHEVLFVPQARIWHHVTPDEGGKLDRALLYVGRNRLIWHGRHRPARLAAVVRWTVAAVIAWFLVGRFRDARQSWRGLVAWLHGSRGRMDA